jgi:hypothetical protein
MNQANTRKLERDHTENVKRRVRVKKVFPSSLNHFCLLLVDNITSDRGPVRFGPDRFGPLYKIYFVQPNISDLLFRLAGLSSTSVP